MKSYSIETTPTQINTKRALALIFFVVLMDVVGISILYPVAAYIVRRYSDEALMVTMLTVIYSAAQFFSAPLFGKLGDRFGRRPVLLISIFGSSIGYIIFGLGGALWVLFLSRLIDGITAGNQSTAAAYIVDISPPEQRAKNLGLIGVAWGAGLILGPALGAGLGQINLNAPAYMAAFLSIVGLILGFFWLPESLPKEQREIMPVRGADLNPFVSIGAIVRKAGLGRLLIVLCLFNFAFNGINSIQTLFLIEKFSAQPWQLGLLLTFVGISVAVVQILFVQRVVQYFGERVVAIISLFGQSLGALAVAFAPVFWLIYPFTVFASGMSTFTFPTIGALASNSISQNEQGTLMGVNTALNSVMTIVGPLWAGVMYDVVVRDSPYWSSAAIFGLSAILLMRAAPVRNLQNVSSN